MSKKRFGFGDNVNLVIDNEQSKSYGTYNIGDLIDLLNAMEQRYDNCVLLTARVQVRNDALKEEKEAYLTEIRRLEDENKCLRNKVDTYKSGNALLKKTLDKEREYD